MALIIDISKKTWMSEAEASVYTTFSKRKLIELRNNRYLPFHKDGRRIIYDRRDLDEYMEKTERHEGGKIRKSRNRVKR